MMALLPAVGFLVKQSLAAWAGLFTGYLLISDVARYRSLAVASRFRSAGFAVASFGALTAVFGGCYALWGRDFVYWTVQVLGHHGVVPLRSIEHALDIWPYIAVGVAGGAVLMQRSKALVGPWLVWAALMALTCYTSGVAWMLNHIGPASLIAGVWLCAGLACVWPSLFRARESWHAWLRAGATVTVVLMLFSGLALVRIPAEPFTPDAYRYVRDIESQFAGERPDHVLLDAGSWVYLPHSVVMKDRAPSIGERGFSQTGDFSGIIGRIRGHYYDKILVRGLQSPDFWYDTASWERPSGIRQALLDSYRVVATIPGVQRPASERDHAEDYYLFGDVSVLEPNVETSHEEQNLGTDSHFQKREMVSVPVLPLGGAR
jgi:hypothetical protein